jgi:hypothetical protein
MDVCMRSVFWLSVNLCISNFAAQNGCKEYSVPYSMGAWALPTRSKGKEIVDLADVAHSIAHADTRAFF